MQDFLMVEITHGLTLKGESNKKIRKTDKLLEHNLNVTHNFDFNLINFFVILRTLKLTEFTKLITL